MVRRDLWGTGQEGCLPVFDWDALSLSLSLFSRTLSDETKTKTKKTS